MVLSARILSVSFVALTGHLVTQTSHAALIGYWPVTETSGTVTSNAVAGGADGNLAGNVGFLNDPQRGDVLQFFGTGGYVDAGFIPQQTLTSNFTWSFWAL